MFKKAVLATSLTFLMVGSISLIAQQPSCSYKCLPNPWCVQTTRSCSDYGCAPTFNHPSCASATLKWNALATPTIAYSGGYETYTHINNPPGAPCFKQADCSTIDQAGGYVCPVQNGSTTANANCKDYHTGNVFDECSSCIETPGTDNYWAVAADICGSCGGGGG